uniref:Uncharacterized protein n=1 Tax=Macrostomum lignano TaxID=282301 RepID=A0A1I8FHZ1_9PLAT
MGLGKTLQTVAFPAWPARRAAARRRQRPLRDRLSAVRVEQLARRAGQVCATAHRAGVHRRQGREGAPADASCGGRTGPCCYEEFFR